MPVLSSLLFFLFSSLLCVVSLLFPLFFSLSLCVSATDSTHSHCSDQQEREANPPPNPPQQSAVCIAILPFLFCSVPCRVVSCVDCPIPLGNFAPSPLPHPIPHIQQEKAHDKRRHDNRRHRQWSAHGIHRDQRFKGTTTHTISRMGQRHQDPSAESEWHSLASGHHQDRKVSTYE